MDRDEYFRWVEYHARLFGVPAADLHGMAEWREPFSAGGYTTAELALSSKRMTLETPAPRFLNEHLTRLNAHVRAIKTAERARLEKATVGRPGDADRPVCDRCGGSGAVTVPHRAFVLEGEWSAHHLNAAGEPVRYTEAIQCSCPMGPARHGRLTRWDDYSQRVCEYPLDIVAMHRPVRPPSRPEAVPGLIRQIADRMRALT